VPYQEQTGRIASEQTNTPVRITALFNQGNILEDSYKEEFIDYGNSTEDVIVTLIYRDNEREGVFPRKNSVEVKLRSTDDNSAIRETIDMSAFVTNRDQAILVGKFLCQTRRHSRRAIEFKTFPTDSLVAPGTYIYVELAQNQWDGIHSGTIGPGGALDLPLSSTVRNGSFQFLMYNPKNQTQGTVFRENIAVTQGAAPSLSGFAGFIFVLGRVVQNKRVFRVTEVSMDEEGEVTVKAVEHPVNAQGYSRITNGLAQRVAGLFTIDGRAE
jgi:predicted phage tail protein